VTVGSKKGTIGALLRKIDYKIIKLSALLTRPYSQKIKFSGLIITVFVNLVKCSTIFYIIERDFPNVKDLLMGAPLCEPEIVYLVLLSCAVRVY
jgi:hypothetical protein